MRDAAVLSYRGFMPEKFIKHALESGVRIIEVKYASKDEVLFYLTEKNAEKLLALAERYSLNVTWVSGSVRGAVKRTALRRLSLIPAFFLFVFLLLSFSSRIWLIEFTIDDVRSDMFKLQADGQALIDELYKLNVRPGVARSGIDGDDLAMSLLQRVPDYAYISVRMTGVRLLVEAVHELPAPELFDISDARDLVAQADGIITHIDVFAGVAKVKVGDVVKRGQVLIMGEERVTDESTRAVCALGEVRARCWVSGEAEGSAYEIVKRYTGEVSRESELKLLDYSYPLLRGDSFETEDRIVRRLPIGGLFLPLMIVTTEHREYTEIVKEGDVEEIQEKIALIAQEKAYEILPDGCVMIDKWIDYSMIEGKMIRVRVVLEIERNIAVTRQATLSGGN